MINKDRIVPVTKTDLLTLYATILALGGKTFTVLKADDAEGHFTFPTQGLTYIAAEPVKSFTGDNDGVGTLYFVPAYGCEVEGVDGEAADLYKITRDGGVTPVSPIAE